MRPLRVYLLALAAFVLPTSTANADFTPATLVSGTQLIPFQQATSPALSGNGRYVVFQGTLAGAMGVYRRDLQSGQVVPVAAASEDPAINAPDAAAPSVSADGRYVAFTSAANLDPTNDTGSGCPQVYVRDMQPRPGEATYTLASALDGKSMGLTYEKACPSEPPTRLALGGAQVASGVALSADGRHVVFTVLSPSNLTGPCATTTPVTCPTAASQVAVRDLDARTTTLVSATPNGEAPQGGGAFPSTESKQLGVTGTGSSAAISADGSTVAWLGTNVSLQIPSATDVIEGMARAGLGTVATEVEPLWRHVSDGPLALTRRLLNGSDLNFYFTESHLEPEAVNGGTRYPLTQDFVPPVLSADGTTVVSVANSPTPLNEGSYRYLGATLPIPTDAYAIHVNDDPSMPPRVIPLTATPSFTAQGALSSGVGGVAISPDGSRVAFDTTRTSFALTPPTLISPPAPETAYAYTYEANIALGTVQRVTRTYDGSAPSGEPGMTSLSGDGLSLAFASSASNLFYGDSTPGVSQVYVVREIPTASQVTPQSTSATPITPLPSPDWILSATATAQADGSVLLDAQVPGAGRLGVRATAQLPVPARSSVRNHRHAGSLKATHATAKNRRKTKTNAIIKIPARSIATAGTIAGGPSELQLSLRPPARYRTLIAGRNGIYALLRVTFTAQGRRTLLQEIPVTFRTQSRKKAKG